MLKMKAKHLPAMTRHSIDMLLDRMEKTESLYHKVTTAKLISEGLALMAMPVPHPEKFEELPDGMIEDILEVVAKGKIPKADVLYDPDMDGADCRECGSCSLDEAA